MKNFLISLLALVFVSCTGGNKTEATPAPAAPAASEQAATAPAAPTAPVAAAAPAAPIKFQKQTKAEAIAGCKAQNPKATKEEVDGCVKYMFENMEK